MSFGAGHIQDMNNRMKQNRAQRKSKKAKFKENNRQPIYAKSTTKRSQTNFKTLPENELIEIKERINNRAKIVRKRELIYGLAFVLGLTILIVLLIWVS